MVEINITSSELISAIIGAAAGAVFALLSSYYLIKRKQKNELKKIQNMINDDFYRIYYYVNESIRIIEGLTNGKEFYEYVLNINDNIRTGRSALLLNLPNLRFLLWNSIVSSGKMMELKTDEIQLINTAHDNAEVNFAAINYRMEQFDQKMRHTKENPVQYDIEEVKIRTHMFHIELYAKLQLIEHQFDILYEEIEWIKCEFSTSASKRINEAFSDQPQGILAHLPFPDDEVYEE